MARKRRYINNIDFTNTLIDWIDINGGIQPIPDYVAACFMQIVTRYGSKMNFSGYTYLEDMRSEALEHCVKYANRFNKEKSRNAFAYFTQVTHNAFIQFINKEKKQATMKFNMVRDGMENSHKLDYTSIFAKREWEMEKDEQAQTSKKL